MHIAHLSLTNFRNYGRLELDLNPGATLFYGANAQGKTNLLEAIYYLATARSPQADQDSQLINWDVDESRELIIVGRIVAYIQTNFGPRQVEIRLIKEQKEGQMNFRREALVDQRKVRLLDLIGNLRVVLFLPQDIQVITGPPSDRRRYMDITLCQTDPLYCRSLSRYNKIIEQRNALLRQIAEEGRGRDVLPVYTDKLVQLGALIFTRRSALLASLSRLSQRIHYESLTDQRETVRLSYLPRLSPINGPGRNGDVDTLLADADWLARQSSVSAIEVRFQEALAAAQENDIARGRTTIGPHLDDWRFWVNGHELARFGSRGQQRSAVLALKMAEVNWINAQTGDMPLILLDEVTSELDIQRRTLLLDYIGQATQALLTTTETNMFSDDFLRQATVAHVQSGQLKIESIPS